MIGDDCPRCARPEWSPILDAIDGSSCTSRDSYDCRHVAQRNTVIAALRSVLRSPTNALVLRTASAVLEDVSPSAHSCPLIECRVPGVVLKGTVKVHFAKPTDARPCPASFGRVVDGVLK